MSGVVRESIVDGPGLRFTVFTQGCPHRCPGCHNPDTHDFHGGYDADPSLLLAEFDKNPLLKGMTFSGGEPFAQPAALAWLAAGVHRRGKDVWCYSGYTFEELLAMPPELGARALLAELDVLVDGPFALALRDLNLVFRGSANQRILDVPESLKTGSAVPWRHLDN